MPYPEELVKFEHIPQWYVLVQTSVSWPNIHPQLFRFTPYVSTGCSKISCPQLCLSHLSFLSEHREFSITYETNTCLTARPTVVITCDYVISTHIYSPRRHISFGSCHHTIAWLRTNCVHVMHTLSVAIQYFCIVIIPYHSLRDGVAWAGRLLSPGFHMYDSNSKLVSLSSSSFTLASRGIHGCVTVLRAYQWLAVTSDISSAPHPRSIPSLSCRKMITAFFC